LLVTISANAEGGTRTLAITTTGGTSPPFGGITIQQPGAPQPTTAPQPIPEVEQGNVQTGYVILTPDQNTSAPLTTLTFGTVRNGIVQGQAGVVPFGVTTGATLFMDVLNAAGRNLGLAIANPTGTTNALTVTLKKYDGTTAGTATINIDPYKQTSTFVSELFSANVLGQAFLGSINVQSGTPFAILGLRFAGTDFSALSAGNTGTMIAPQTRSLTAGAATDTPRVGTIGGANAIVLPQFAMGGGWATQLALVNTSSTAASGRVDVFDTNGQPLAVKLNGAMQSTFTYSIPVGGSFVLAPRDQNGQTPM
jgi:hypothetical protein